MANVGGPTRSTSVLWVSAVGLLFACTYIAWSVGGVAAIALLLLAGTSLSLAFRLSESSKSATETNLHSVLGALATPVLVIAPEGRIDAANAAALALFGYASEEIVGQNISILMSESDAKTHQGYTEIFRGVRSRMGEDREILGVTRDGREVPIEVIVSSADIDGTRKIIGVVHDVSARRARERKMEKLVADLERSNAELDQFAYVASHDLKAPLRVIDNASQWLAEDLAAHLTDDTRESLDMLRGRVHRMERLLNALLELSRIGRVRADTDFVTGAELAECILGRIEKPDEFDVNFDGSFLEARLPGAPLAMVLGHLVDNGIRHHDRERGQIDVALTFDGPNPTFTVTDDGPGIPVEYHQKVFEAFQTLTRRDERETNGMGLAIVAKHVQLVNGQITIEPSTGRGTTMRLEWPIATTSFEKLERSVA